MYPAEIMDFFKIEGNTTLLIKGDPGVGKTIFSLQILSKLKDELTGVYFSTRSVIRAIVKQLPWIKDVLSKNQLVDAVKPAVMSKDHGDIIEWTTLPQFLRSLYYRLKELQKEGKKVIVVVDSVDAITNALELSIEKVINPINQVLYNMGAKGIYITERSGITLLDYLCDGVVLLKKELHHDRIVRKIYLEKLRGVEIKKPFYTFTVHSGRFKAFARFYKIPVKISKQHPFISDNKDTHFAENKMFSTGSTQLDKILYGYAYGSTILVKFEEIIPTDAYSIFIGPLTENFLSQDRLVIYMPSKNTPSLDVALGFAELIGDKVKNNLKIISLAEKISQENITSTNVPHISKWFIGNLIEQVKMYVSQKERFLLVIDVDHLMAFYENSAEILKAITILAKLVKESQNLMIVKTFSSLEIVNQKIAALSDYYFEVFSIGNQLFMYGVKPYTPIYNISLEVVNEHPTTVYKVMS